MSVRALSIPILCSGKWSAGTTMNLWANMSKICSRPKTFRGCSAGSHGGKCKVRIDLNSICPKSPGSRLPVVISARQLEDPDGRIFAIVTFTDITEQKSAEMDLRRANLLLEARERAIEEDLLLAARIQQSLAPRSLTWAAASVETYYQAARTIGGDYGLVTPGDDYLTLLLGDVSGHGIGSALVANRIYTETISLIEAGAETRARCSNISTDSPFSTWEVLSCTSRWPPRD